MTPARSPSALAHWPAQLTTTSHSTVSLVGPDAGHPTTGRPVLDVVTRHAHPLDHARAALARPARERLGQVGRVDLAVTGQPERAEQVVHPHRRPQLLRTLRADHLALEVVGDRVGRRTPELGHPVLGPRDDHAADVAVAGGEACLGLERGVELGGVLHEPGARLRGTQRPDQPGRVPGRASRETPLLEQQHVGRPPAWSGGRPPSIRSRPRRRPPPGRGTGARSRRLNHRWPPARASAAARHPGTSPPPSRSAPCRRSGSRSRSGWRPPG